jgi:hypothetical protein
LPVPRLFCHEYLGFTLRGFCCIARSAEQQPQIRLLIVGFYVIGPNPRYLRCNRLRLSCLSGSKRKTQPAGVRGPICRRGLDRFRVRRVGDIGRRVLFGVSCKRQQFLRGVGNLQRALPFVSRASCRAKARLRHGQVHVLYHGIDDRMFAQEQIFDFTPALQSGERVHVLQKKVLPLDRACLR